MNQPVQPVQPAQPAATLTAVAPSSTKYLDLARKIKEIEMENAKLAIKLEKSNQHLFRLKLERNILMEKLTSVEPKFKNSNSIGKEEIFKEMENEEIDEREN